MHRERNPQAKIQIDRHLSGGEAVLAPGAGCFNFLAVIGELERNAEVFFAEKGNHGLKFIFAFAYNPDLVPLDLGLDLEFVVSDYLDILAFSWGMPIWSVSF
jgi:hypothetical protein